ncbi:hypothetical protein CspeluHIS016_0304470 [Cutaneotrichosporon spelunceum]|uniref:CCAAT-binding factor domain-containing protein n=1 Tax=Cutaneotrichosporon spelunceum TaxID=1672016 RepID=A0AAD3TU71_9TREE|nr:hypothetical protein CspeluHIS016_0304470 [Cutaneotrichosporon spelunceum]
MAKNKGKTSAAGASKPRKSFEGSKSTRGGISDELRQAVADLGGDDEDLELIAGVDNDDADELIAAKGLAMDEGDLRKALGDFMKGLDFGSEGTSTPQAKEAEEENEEDGEDEDEESEEEVEDASESEEEEEESDDSEEAEEDEDEEELELKPKPKAAPESAPKAAPQRADPEPTSGRTIPAEPTWADLVPELTTPKKPLGRVAPEKLNNYRQRGERLLSEVPKPQRIGSSSDAAFISQILASGTHNDKLSALVLIVRESPIHAVSELERLRNMAGWRDGAPGGGARDLRLASVRALADWWVTGGGKAAGKLKYFADQPLLAHPDVTDRHLVVYMFEDFLKKWYFNLLQILEALTHDQLPYVRMKALDVVFQLLSGNAEQEQNLLRLGVNKLGDTDRAVASKASYHLLQLLQVHPAMKAVVAREVSALVLKTALTGPAGAASSGAHMRFDDDEPKKKEEKKEVNEHGRYYGLITLNQMTLTTKDNDVAGRLVEVYFEVFREILGDEEKHGDVVDEDEEREKITGKVGKWQGRRKGAKVKGGRKEEEELVESGAARLIAAVLTGINRALPFAKLDEDHFSGYMETLFKICHAGTFNTSIQALQLIFQVSKSRQTVSDRFYRTLYESLFDARLLMSSKQAMYLNLLFKALKHDTSLPRVMAFVKRLLQMLTLHQPPFISGALYLLGELFNTTPGLRRMLIEPEDDGEEHFVDADAELPAEKAEASKSSGPVYDGKKREPQYAHADTSCLWELLPFTTHFHPSVALQANQLLMGEQLTGSPDISLNTLISFLDKFVYRNPKKTAAAKGASIMQPAAVSDHTGTVIRMRGARAGGDAVNSESFWRKKVEDVPADQLFFHKFFSAKLARKEASRKKRADDDEMSENEFPESLGGSDDEVSDEEAGEEAGEEEEQSDLEEAEIWKAMQGTMPDAGDDMGLSDDSDEDVDYSSDEEGGEGEEAGLESEEGEDEDEEMEPDHAGDREDVSDDEDFPSFAEDDDDLISLDEMPDEVLNADSDEEEEEDAAAGAKRKRREERKERRKKRKEMPAFASYEDYAKLIEADDSE